jgi:hypothetical protein
MSVIQAYHGLNADSVQCRRCAQQETSSALFYDLIGAGEQRWRKDNTEGLRRS